VNNCVVEVKQICLVVGLEFMEEIEELESEDGVWSNQHGREPSPPEQLSTAVKGLFRITHTVSNNNLMDAAEIENCELVTPFSNCFPMGHGPYELTQTHGSWTIRQAYDRPYGP